MSNTSNLLLLSPHLKIGLTFILANATSKPTEITTFREYQRGFYCLVRNIPKNFFSFHADFNSSEWLVIMAFYPKPDSAVLVHVSLHPTVTFQTFLQLPVLHWLTILQQCFFPVLQHHDDIYVPAVKKYDVVTIAIINLRHIWKMEAQAKSFSQMCYFWPFCNPMFANCLKTSQHRAFYSSLNVKLFFLPSCRKFVVKCDWKKRILKTFKIWAFWQNRWVFPEETLENFPILYMWQMFPRMSLKWYFFFKMSFHFNLEVFWKTRKTFKLKKLENMMTIQSVFEKKYVFTFLRDIFSNAGGRKISRKYPGVLFIF